MFKNEAAAKPRRWMTRDEWARFSAWMFVVGVAWGFCLGFVIAWWLHG